MSEDIDIEEHDILENLHKQKVAIDIKSIKSEIDEPKDEDSGFNIKVEEDDNFENINSNCNTKFSLTFETPPVWDPTSTKIILGTKIPLKLNEETEVITTDDYISDYKNLEDSLKYDWKINCTEVTLVNYSYILEKSHRYCKKCKIYFGSVDALYNHNAATHLYLEVTGDKITNKYLFGSVNQVKNSFTNVSGNEKVKRYGLLHPNTIKDLKTGKTFKQTYKQFAHDDKVEILKSFDLSDDVPLKFLTNRDENETVCKICKHNFSNKNNMYRHYNNVHLKNLNANNKSKIRKPKNKTKRKIDFNCYICRKKFSNIHHLLRHENTKIHLEMKNRLALKKTNARISHNPSVKDKNQSIEDYYPCYLCDRKYSKQCHLLRHQKEKGHQKPKAKRDHLCNHCNKNFPDNDTLIQHLYDIIPHKGDNVLSQKSDTPNVNVASTSKIIIGSNPNSNIGSDNQDIDFDSSDSSDNYDDALNQKRKCLLQCKVCGTVFKTFEFYTKHINLKHNIKKLKPDLVYSLFCKNCLNRFPTNSSLNSHIDFKHPELYNKKYSSKHDSNKFKMKLSTELNKKIISNYKNLNPAESINDLKVNNKISNHSKANNKISNHPKANNKISHGLKMNNKISHDLKTNSKISYNLKVNYKRSPKKINNKDKRFRSATENKLIYCKHCKCCLYRVFQSHIQSHSTGKCKKAKKLLCQTCGLYFSSKTMSNHVRHHNLNPNLNLESFQFLSISDKSVISLPILDFFKCIKCKVQFTTLRLSRNHKCPFTEATECVVCCKKLEKTAYKLHMRFHINNDKDESLEEKSILECKILYLCSDCNVATDSYDKSIEHSQNHILGLHHIKLQTVECGICKLNVDKRCYPNHQKIHNFKNVHADSFTVLNYSYKKLMSDAWFDLFDSIAKTKMQEILAKSIYLSHSIRFKLLLTGSPKNTLYKCGLCLRYVYRNEVVSHAQNEKDCSNMISHVCSICNANFASSASLDAHLQLHKHANANINSFRIISFNSPADKKLTRMMEEFKIKNDPGSKAKANSKMRDNKSQSETEPDAADAKAINIFKCDKCKCCLFLNKYKYHKCTVKNLKFYDCRVCDVRTMSCYRPQHEALHDITKYKQIKVNSFKPNSYNLCGIKIIKNEEPVRQVPVERNIVCMTGVGYHSKVKCVECGLLFASKDLAGHMQKKHAPTDFDKTDDVSKHSNICPEKSSKIEDLNSHSKLSDDAINKVSQKVSISDDIYGCFKCGSFDTRKDLPNHKCDDRKKVCEKCGLHFSNDNIKTHMSVHHGSKDFKLENLTYHVVNSGYDSKDKKYTDLLRKAMKPFKCTNDEECKKYDKNLYRCRICSVNYMDKNIFNNHLNRDHLSNIWYHIPCPECGILFNILTLPYHRYFHHEIMKLKLDDFVINFDLAVNEDALNSKSFLYMCYKCKLCFVKDVAHSCNEISLACNKCNLMIASSSIEMHTKNHHNDINNMMIDINFEVINAGSDELDKKLSKELQDAMKVIGTHQNQNVEHLENKLYECESCTVNFLNKADFESHIEECSSKSPVIHLVLKCTICQKKFFADTYKRHVHIHHEKLKIEKFETVILSKQTPSLGNADDSEINKEINESVTKKENETKVEDMQCMHQHKMQEVVDIEKKESTKSSNEHSDHRVFKCNDCDVFFMDRKVCMNHVTNHKRLDDKEFIACKLCDFQFQIESLVKHLEVHHNDDDDNENIIVEEFEQFANKTASIDIEYSKIDKVQSELISTTTDDN